jgi:hypothetical protein
MLTSHEHFLNGGSKTGPGLGEFGKALRTGWGYGVVDTATPVDGFAPGLDRAVAFEAVENWIDDALAHGNDFVGAGADGLNNLVAVHLVLLEKTEDEELRNAVHEVRIGFSGRHGDHNTLKFEVLQEDSEEMF